jgi:hypothetical protein
VRTTKESTRSSLRRSGRRRHGRQRDKPTEREREILSGPACIPQARTVESRTTFPRTVGRLAGRRGVRGSASPFATRPSTPRISHASRTAESGRDCASDQDDRSCPPSASISLIGHRPRDLAL